MLIQTGKGSISFVAGCTWIHSVHPGPAPHGHTRTEQQTDTNELANRNRSNER